jgi:hypothetical protein
MPPAALLLDPGRSGSTLLVLLGRRLVATALTFATLDVAPCIASSDCGAYEDPVRTTHRFLTWRDFKSLSVPDALRGSDVVAYVSTSIALEPLRFELTNAADGTWTARVLEICVRAFLLKTGSGFTRHLASADDLAHEQGHFDITELFARALAARLDRVRSTAALSDVALEDAQRRVDGIVRRTLESWRAVQATYDAETTCARAQIRWRRWISAQLREAPGAENPRLEFSVHAAALAEVSTSADGELR